MEKIQKVGIGFLIVAFVAIVISLTLFQEAAGFVGTLTTTDTSENQTITAPASVGGTVELLGQNVVGTPIVTNASNGTGTGLDGIIGVGNYTIAQGLGDDGQIATIFTLDNESVAGQSLNVSYDYEPDGYIGGTGGGSSRAVASIILVIAAIGIAFIAFPKVQGI